MNKLQTLPKVTQMKKIRVNLTNSRVFDGKLYITQLKAIGIKSKLLADKIDWHTSAIHPKLGKLVHYAGAYDRPVK